MIKKFKDFMKESHNQYGSSYSAQVLKDSRGLPVANYTVVKCTERDWIGGVKKWTFQFPEIGDIVNFKPRNSGSIRNGFSSGDLQTGEVIEVLKDKNVLILDFEGMETPVAFKSEVEEQNTFLYFYEVS